MTVYRGKRLHTPAADACTFIRYSRSFYDHAHAQSQSCTRERGDKPLAKSAPFGTHDFPHALTQSPNEPAAAGRGGGPVGVGVSMFELHKLNFVPYLHFLSPRPDLGFASRAGTPSG